MAAPERARQACAVIGLCRSASLQAAMLEAIRREQSLLVLTARLVAPISSTRQTLVAGLVVDTDSQASIVPATISYRLDLAALGPEDLAWDRAARRLRVRRPPVRIGQPAIHWAEAETFSREGWLPLNDSIALRLQQDNQQQAPALFLRQAQAPALLAEANRAADAALAATLRLPLAAAGFPDARVVVEARPS